MNSLEKSERKTKWQKGCNLHGVEKVNNLEKSEQLLCSWLVDDWLAPEDNPWAAYGELDEDLVSHELQKGLDFRRDLIHIINKNSVESFAGNTPDHIIADHLMQCLYSLGRVCRKRSKWYRDDNTGIPEYE